MIRLESSAVASSALGGATTGSGRSDSRITGHDSALFEVRIKFSPILTRIKRPRLGRSGWERKPYNLSTQVCNCGRVASCEAVVHL
ncbi:hypothetical protein PoB_005246300 [Plakobranchus ocellatus]|uniref:Uncharacterized protein n=1 Tax=Plakobranchus ocellatus TaxID=259542 RepID=A0AAV4C222_9GAST|nr:hypothetical protein PoB_005246300 [Plakobranchus ocellatus]